MAKTQSYGTCSLCKGRFSKAGMAKHLAQCVPAHEKGGGKKARVFDVLVQGRHQPRYWLHLEVPAAATLADLDGFLRAIWLECCGHLSAFTIMGIRYSVSPDSDWDDDDDMKFKVGALFRPGLACTYEYDFGSTTELALKVVSEGEGKPAKPRAVRLLARNEAPAIPCGGCGQPATAINSEEAWDEGGWLCDRCLEQQGLSEEECLPVVNSPRTGVCGYTGP